MKKIAPIVALVVIAAFSSCKKNYTCTCTTTVNGVNYGTTTTTIKETKSKAKTACTNLQTSQTYGGVTATSTCSI